MGQGNQCCAFWQCHIDRLLVGLLGEKGEGLGRGRNEFEHWEVWWETEYTKIGKKCAGSRKNIWQIFFIVLQNRK